MNREANNIFDVIILGAGPTGLYGGYYCGLKHLKTLILEINNTYGGAPARLYPEKPLYDIPGCVSITGAELVNNMYKQMQSVNHWSIKYNVEIIEIKKVDNEIYLYELVDRNNEIYCCNNIIFSTGYGAFEFISFDEDIKINSDVEIDFYVQELSKYHNKDVVICGGGDSAIDTANSLKDISKSISLIHRRPTFKAKEANVLKATNHTNFFLNKTIYAITNNSIYFFDNDNNEKMYLNYDYLIVLYGTKMIPNNIKLNELYNNIHKINVNPLTLEAINYPNIFACGLANNMKHEQTIVTGISDIIKVIANIARNKKSITSA